MVRIDSTGSVGRARSTQRAHKTSRKGSAAGANRASFAASLSEAAGAEAVEALEAAAGATDLGLLALQERGTRQDEQARKQAIAYGEGLIERLQALHVRLLSGVVSEEELLHLEAYFADGADGERDADGVGGAGGAGGAGNKGWGAEEVKDKQLRSILDEIELRVQVELAKKRR